MRNFDSKCLLYCGPIAKGQSGQRPDTWFCRVHVWICLSMPEFWTAFDTALYRTVYCKLKLFPPHKSSAPDCTKCLPISISSLIKTRSFIFSLITQMILFGSSFKTNSMWIEKDDYTVEGFNAETKWNSRIYMVGIASIFHQRDLVGRDSLNAQKWVHTVGIT